MNYMITCIYDVCICTYIIYMYIIYMYMYIYVYYINKHCLWNKGNVLVVYFSGSINTSSRGNFISGNYLFFIAIIHNL